MYNNNNNQIFATEKLSDCVYCNRTWLFSFFAFSVSRGFILSYFTLQMSSEYHSARGVPGLRVN